LTTDEEVKQGPQASIMTARELAEYLRVHPSTIYRLLRDGTLPAFRVGFLRCAFPQAQHVLCSVPIDAGSGQYEVFGEMRSVNHQGNQLKLA
jgi:excisionase family DNA binding protein